MHTELMARRIGSSLGLILPQHLVAAMSLREGDRLLAIVNVDTVHLRPWNRDFESALACYLLSRASKYDAYRSLARWETARRDQVAPGRLVP
jgi:antitoxin component of MazEF toxin-antitoxin module